MAQTSLWDKWKSTIADIVVIGGGLWAALSFSRNGHDDLKTGTAVAVGIYIGKRIKDGKPPSKELQEEEKGQESFEHRNAITQEQKKETDQLVR